MKRFPLFCWLIFCYLSLAVASGDSTDSCAVRKLEVERLPDLNIPRNAHNILCVNGEVTVVGGHTKSFIPTATAEYYKDGEWHLMETEYPHDNGICVVLKSGKVLLAGGHAEPMGVGQTYPVEEYDPATHTFRGFSCLSTKRTLAVGAELDSGRVVVTGNWYAKDGIELFDGDRDFSRVKGVSVGRATPYLLRTSDDNVLILGSGGTHGEALFSDKVDRLKGDPLQVPLLRQWQPLFYEAPFCSNIGFIGNEDANDYSWLVPVQDRTVGDSTDWVLFKPLAFLHVRDTIFSLLPTTCPAPVKGPYGPIHYYSPVIADRQAHRGYMHGIDKDNRHYVLCVEYDKTPAPLTLYYTDPLPEAGFPEIVLTDDGNLMIVGGITYNKPLNGTLQNDNFSPLSTVFLLRVGNSDVAESSDGVIGKWLWGILALAILAIAIALFLIRKRHNHQTSVVDAPDSDTSASNPNEVLMQRISRLMEQQQLYLDSDLKLSDVAAMLATNRNAISNCINSQHGCSFTQFVNTYRVEYAQKLMRQQSDIKISEVWMSSGFSTERTFLRTFKQQTGMTPSNWKSKID
ncbi:MAG: helix-turn-helix domain-containing protein [Prevotella sp.]|jgi:AraC-like DNA-binding protein|nr:helix-turn-helix domain-containing protein [Prevotella sp.]